MDDKNRESAKEIKIRAGSSIEDVVETFNLLKRISEESFFVSFNNIKLYSTDYLTVDDAYKTVYGYTKEELVEMDNKRREKADACKKQAESMIEQRYGEGIKYMYPERFEEWKEWLGYYAKCFSLTPEDSKYPDVIIECLKKLENGENFETVYENSSEKDHAMETPSTLLNFSKVGPEYFKYAYKRKNGADLPDELLKKVEAKKEENRKLAELHKSKREVSIDEIVEVASGETLESTTKAKGAVTNLGDETVIRNDGQSHADK